MMLTRTSEHALQAMIYLVQNRDDWPISGKSIAQATGMPPKYLSKILADLVRAGVLQSARGKSGGFRLADESKKTVLLEVLAPFETLEPRRCPFGNQECSDENPCLAHNEWKKVLEARQRFLRRTSVNDVALKEPNRKRTATANHRRAKRK